MNYTENKKRCCGFLWVGSESKGLWCLCREGKLVLIPHPEGRAGSLCDGHGNGKVIFGTTALLLFRTPFGTAVFRITSCWQGVNCKASTRSISLDHAL